MKPTDEHRTKSPVRRALSDLAGRLGFAYYDMYYSLTDLELPWEPIGNKMQVEAELASERDLESIASRLPEVQRYWFDQAIQAGSICHLARHEGQIVGHIFRNYRAILMLGEDLARVPKGFVYGHNAYIFHEFRGKGLYTVFIRESHEFLKSQGIRYTVNLIERKNLPGLGPGKHYAPVRWRAPILYLPGLKPIVLGRGFHMMKEAAKKLDRERGENDLPLDA